MSRSVWSAALGAGVVWLAAAPVLAQQSASYRLDEHVFNEGGHPEGGVVLTSASFSVRLDSIGEGPIAPDHASASFKVSDGFGSPYLPPGEVQNVRFIDFAGLAWDPEPSAGDYNLYRGPIGDLASGGYGACLQNGIASTSAADQAIPGVGAGFIYIVTVESLLDEEGTKGFDSLGHERPNDMPCP